MCIECGEIEENSSCNINGNYNENANSNNNNTNKNRDNNSNDIYFPRTETETKYNSKISRTHEKLNSTCNDSSCPSPALHPSVHPLHRTCCGPPHPYAGGGGPRNIPRKNNL